MGKIVRLVMFLSLLASTAVGQIKDGDVHYANRAAGHEGWRADPTEINAAIKAYEAAMSSEPATIEASWKLCRALRFKARFTSADSKGREDLLNRANRALSEGFGILEKQLVHAGKGTTVFNKSLFSDEKVITPSELDSFIEVVRGIPGAENLMYEDVRLYLARQSSQKQRSVAMAVALMGIGSIIDDDGPTRALGLIIWNSHTTMGFQYHLKVRGEKEGGWSTDDAIRYLRLNATEYPKSKEAQMYLASALQRLNKKRLGDDWEGKSAEVVRILKFVADTPADPSHEVEDEFYRELAQELLYNRDSPLRWDFPF